MESESPATSESNFTDADSLSPYCMGGIPDPLVSGTTQFVVLSGLIPETTYYFAIKAVDEVNNWSDLSNGATMGRQCLQQVSGNIWNRWELT
jgi:chitodextrinase